MMTITKTTVFTRSMAADVVRFVTGSFAADLDVHGYSEAELCTLARKLGYLIDADVQWTALDQLVVSILELEALERGTHPMLEVSRSGSVDNTDWVRANIEDRIREDVQYVLTGAHFHVGLVAA